MSFDFSSNQISWIQGLVSGSANAVVASAYLWENGAAVAPWRAALQPSVFWVCGAMVALPRYVA